MRQNICILILGAYKKHIKLLKYSHEHLELTGLLTFLPESSYQIWKAQNETEDFVVSIDGELDDE